MKLNSKTIIPVCLALFLGVSQAAWAKSYKSHGKEIGEKLDKAEDKAKEKASDAKEKAKDVAHDAKEKGKEIHDKAKDKAHDLIDKT